MYCVLTEPFWPFTGPYTEETTIVLCGYRFRHYLSIKHIIDVPNRSTTPEENFVILKSDVLHVPAPIIGIVHRHPPEFPHPSWDDIEGLPSHLLGGVWCEGVVRWYTSNGETKVRYLS